MKILITGTAGFIGYHLTNLLAATTKYEIIGIDNINDYYDPKLKQDRLADLGVDATTGISSKYSNFKFWQIDLTNKDSINQLFSDHKFDIVINLAAQAGVRYSLTNPDAYIAANITGFLNILEACRHNNVSKLLYASSSSVYGSNTNYPFKESDRTDTPVSLYAASKKSNELMAHTYSHLFGLNTIGLRFFTVYGPWGRPDMALFMFTKSILEGKPIDVFNNGEMERDFTYVDDIVNAIARMVEQFPQAEPKYRVYNIGHGSPVKLMDFVRAIEKEVGKPAQINYLPLQPGDVPKTYADTSALEKDFGYKPNVGIEQGIKNFVQWYRKYYQV